MFFSKWKSPLFFLTVCGVIALSGCQTIRDHNARSKEEMLAAAGFRMKQALTPEQLANIQNMPQRKLVPHTKDGRVMYVYADAKACRCVYVGTEKNYQDYQRMVYRKELAEEQETTAEINSENRFNWDLWGSWGPWGY